MNDFNTNSTKLYQQFKEYHLKDTRWQNNFINRCRRLAQYIAVDTSDQDEIYAMMRLDIISLRTGRNIHFKESQAGR